MQAIIERCCGLDVHQETVVACLLVGSVGAYFRSHSTVSQCARAASAASERLLVWIGPLSSTSTTGLAYRPGCGP